CDGHIADEELTAAKEALLSNLRSTHDSPGAIEGYYASAAISGIGMTPAAFMEADLFDVSVDYLLGRENLKTQDAEKVFKKTVQSNKQFKLGCILIVIGLALTCTLMYTQKDMIAYCGNPLKMLMMAGEWTDWLMYLLVLWPVFSGFGMCWTAIYSKE
ncbi:MAG: hypothetical protein IIV99_03520, partial [Oscillospiraceae bacterium]|nr:hypothetical protein [Oscillospiraceae bacterium]